jgi:hypothetical protein
MNVHNIEVMSSDHRRWLEDPITKTLLYILNKHEGNIADAIASSSMDPNLTDAIVRQYAVQLQNTKTIKKIVYDTPTFIAKSH